MSPLKRIDEGPGSGQISTGMFFVFFVIGVLLLASGLFVGSMTDVIRRPDDGNEKRADRFETVNRWMEFFSSNMVRFGILSLFVGTFLAGILSRDLHPTLRGGLLIAGSLILIAGFRSGFLFW